MMIRSVLAVLSGLVLATGVSLAAGKSFSDLDKDDSGALSRAEAAMVDADFSDVDADGNGKISKSEYLAAASTESD